jgi:hypothetical protein
VSLGQAREVSLDFDFENILVYAGKSEKI